MYKILSKNAFGFVVELENDKCFVDGSYKVFINGELYCEDNKNVISIFSLKPSTQYKVKFQLEYSNLVFDIKTESIDYLINIKDYNAIGDGVADDTTAINTAIYTAPKNATIYFPKGEYLVNNILLKSNTNIYFEDGVVIKQNFIRENLSIVNGYQKNYNHTKATINTSWEGNPLSTYCPLIYGKDVENVTIYGNGTIDGNGDISGYWENPKVKNVAYRPKNIELVNCSDVTIIGITSKNSASWNVHPFYSNSIKLYCMNLESIDTSPNTDGINPESCDNVEIIGCRFSVGDDCIAIKSGKYFMSLGEKHRVCKNIVVRNCKMERGHGAIVIGSEISNGVKDVTVEKCHLTNTDRGIRVKTRRGRGEKSVIDNIRINNVIMDKVIHGVVLNMFYFCDPDGHSDYVRSKIPLEVSEETPSIKKIYINNVQFNDIVGTGIFAYGLPEQKIELLSIKNSKFSFIEGHTDVEPAMLDDFENDDELGIFIKNVEVFKDEDNIYIGKYKKIID